MARVPQKDTRPEVLLRKALHARGLRYRKNVRTLPGSPDLVFPKHRAVVFVNGCYWHHHEGCERATVPKQNRSFWKEKFRRNRERDARNVYMLIDKGWRVAIVWECAIGVSPSNDLVANIVGFIEGIERYVSFEKA